MDVRADLGRVLDDLLGDDPRRALIAYRQLTVDELPWLEQRVVALARRDNWNWATIGRLLGRSRQAVRERFAVMKLTKRPDPYLEEHRRQNEYLTIVNRMRERPRYSEGDPVAW